MGIRKPHQLKAIEWIDDTGFLKCEQKDKRQ